MTSEITEAPPAAMLAQAVAVVEGESDATRAEKFIERWGTDIKYVVEREVWIHWDNGWREDNNGGLVRKAVALSGELLREVALMPAFTKADGAARREAGKRALDLGNKRVIEPMLSMAQADVSIQTSVVDIDADQWVIGAKNAVVDLATGAFRPYERRDLITKRMNVVADAEAKCPRWEKFVAEVFPDKDLLRYVWKAAGATLTGGVGEQVFFFCYGNGNNGKSVFLEILQHIFGEYGGKAGKGLTAAGKPGDYPLREVAELSGLRYVVASEVDEGDRLNEDVLKDLTGSDTLRGEFKYEHAFNFRPTFKLWFAGNHKPSVRGTDGGIWRRPRLVPFTQKFEGAAIDTKLDVKLKGEASGILNWLIKGCALWQEEGLTPPAIIQEALDIYREDEDPLGDFLMAHVEAEPRGVGLPHDKLMEAYLTWAKGMGIQRPYTSKMLTTRLRDRGWQSTRSKHVRNIWMGWQLVSERIALPTAY